MIVSIIERGAPANNGKSGFTGLSTDVSGSAATLVCASESVGRGADSRRDFYLLLASRTGTDRDWIFEPKIDDSPYSDSIISRPSGVHESSRRDNGPATHMELLALGAVERPPLKV